MGREDQFEKIIDRKFFQRPVSTFSMQPLKIFSADQTQNEILQVMAKEKLPAICIQEQDRIVGIVTERDCLNRPKVENAAWKTGKIREIMTHNPSYLSAETNAYEVIESMILRKFRQVFIKVGEELKLLTIRDVVLEITQFFKREMEPYGTLKSPKDFLSDLVDEQTPFSLESLHQCFNFSIFHHPVVKAINDPALILEAQETVLQALQKIREKKVSAAVIVEHGTLIKGIITERDFLSKIFTKYDDLSRVSVSQVMTQDPHFLLQTNKIVFAFNNMLHYNYRNILVTNEDMYPVSIVSLQDLLDYLFRKLF